MKTLKRLFQVIGLDNLFKNGCIVVNANKILRTWSVSKDRYHNIGMVIATEIASNSSLFIIGIQ